MPSRKFLSNPNGLVVRVQDMLTFYLKMVNRENTTFQSIHTRKPGQEQFQHGKKTLLGRMQMAPDLVARCAIAPFGQWGRLLFAYGHGLGAAGVEGTAWRRGRRVRYVPGEDDSFAA